MVTAKQQAQLATALEPPAGLPLRQAGVQFRRRMWPEAWPLYLILTVILHESGVLGMSDTGNAVQSMQAAALLPQFGSKTVPFVQPGCTVMFRPGSWCLPIPSPFVKGCCTPGYACISDPSSITGYKCMPVGKEQLDYSYEQSAKGNCSYLVDVGGQCGGAGFSCYEFNTCDQFGPWRGFCCPNGYTCQPYSSLFRKWTCQVDVQDQPPVDADKEILQYPPRPMPADSCTCRHGWNKQRISMACPSPWASPAGTSKVPPALKLAPGGALVSQSTGTPAVLRGINWFGWSVGSFNFDGMWAYCDDNTTDSQPPCQQDGDIPPYGVVDKQWSPAVGEAGQRLLNISYWGKRRMTNDFASIVYRIKLLGFNAIRVQFTFSSLNQDIPSDNPEFFPCLLDSDEYIGAYKTMDPELIKGLGDNWSLDKIKPYLPKYTGMPHPPPKTGNPQCDNPPWSAPFLDSYKGGRGKTLNLTMCNWYLPQGPGVPALYRFLWQLQYLVSQGFYVLLDWSSTRDNEVNMQNPEVLAQNWGNLWKTLTDIPAYKDNLAGRIFPDLVNEPSRWGCQWQDTCHEVNGTKACAPILQTFGMAAAAIWQSDPTVPVFINGLGQDNSTKYRQCGNYYPGMHWGDGFITNKDMIQKYGISDPSDIFTTAFTQKLGFVRIEHGKPQLSRLVLSPHIYPGSVTGDVSKLTATIGAITYRWDLSWGWKAQGLDSTSAGASIPALPVVIGESGAKDWGDNSINNTDTTMYYDVDKLWLNVVAAYLRALSEKTGRQPSWFWWAWNANSGDTKGLVGPNTTWREVQWTKIRLLIRIMGLRPWYCGWWPEFCDNVTW